MVDSLEEMLAFYKTECKQREVTMSRRIDELILRDMIAMGSVSPDRVNFIMEQIHGPRGPRDKTW